MHFLGKLALLMRKLIVFFNLMSDFGMKTLKYVRFLMDFLTISISTPDCNFSITIKNQILNDEFQPTSQISYPFSPEKGQTLHFLCLIKTSVLNFDNYNVSYFEFRIAWKKQILNENLQKITTWLTLLSTNVKLGSFCSFSKCTTLTAFLFEKNLFFKNRDESRSVIQLKKFTVWGLVLNLQIVNFWFKFLTFSITTSDLLWNHFRRLEFEKK